MLLIVRFVSLLKAPKLSSLTGYDCVTVGHPEVATSGCEWFLTTERGLKGPPQSTYFQSAAISATSTPHRAVWGPPHHRLLVLNPPCTPQLGRGNAGTAQDGGAHGPWLDPNALVRSSSYLLYNIQRPMCIAPGALLRPLVHMIFFSVLYSSCWWCRWLPSSAPFAS